MTEAELPIHTGRRPRTRWCAFGSPIVGFVAMLAAASTAGFSLIAAPIGLALARTALNDTADDAGLDRAIATLGWVLSVLGTISLVVWFGYQAVRLS